MNGVKFTLPQLLVFWEFLEIADAVEKQLDKPENIGFTRNFVSVKKKTDYVHYYSFDEYNFIIANGTNKWREFFNNLLAFPKNGYSFGFYNTAMRFRKPTEKLLPLAKQNFFLGHSRGCFLQILANELIEDGIISADNTDVINFGAPEMIKDEGVEKMQASGIEVHDVYTKKDWVRKLGASERYATHKYVIDDVLGIDHLNYGRAVKSMVSVGDRIEENGQSFRKSFCRRLKR